MNYSREFLDGGGDPMPIYCLMFWQMGMGIGGHCCLLYLKNSLQFSCHENNHPVIIVVFSKELSTENVKQGK